MCSFFSGGSVIKIAYRTEADLEAAKVKISVYGPHVHVDLKRRR